MVRKGAGRAPPRRGILSAGTGSGGNAAAGDPLHLHHSLTNGIASSQSGGKVTVLEEERCPQCNVTFNTTNFRKVTESCGHTKCRRCIIQSEDGCSQCETSDVAHSSTQLIPYSGKGPPDTTARVPTTRRAAAAQAAAANHRLQSATNSRTNSLNSGRPTSSSPGSSLSGRQSSSVYSDSADSDSFVRFPSAVIGNSVDSSDGYHNTIDFDTMAELTSPTLVDTGFMALSSDGFPPTDNKSYSSIVSEESEFSKGLMGLRKITEPFPLTTRTITLNQNNHHHHNNNGASVQGTSQNTMVTMAQLKEMPTLGLVSATINSSTSTTTTAPSSSSSFQLEMDQSSRANNKTASGGGSPDITQVPRETPRSKNKSNSPTPITPPAVPNSRLSALLTRSSSRGTSSSGATKQHSSGVAQSEEKKRATNLEKKEEASSSSSPQQQNLSKMDEDDDYEEDEGKEDDDEDFDPKQEGDDEPVPKKKKKRSPVVIHDHITVLGGEPPMYQCNLCQKKFKTKAHIKYHEFCQQGEKPFKCEQCGQGFIAKSHYEYHLRTHTGERPYVCPKCGKGFNQRGKVTRHMRSHTGEKPFICTECNRGFANAQALRSHTLIHTGERPFACTFCNKRFTGMTNLKKHVITHTGERPFSCNHCGKSFGLKWTLDLHLRTHSSERPYACDQCTRAFSNSKDLRRHLVIHSGERPFKCWICGTAFRRKDNLDRHIKNTHNQPKEVAKKLANEAAAEYLKLTTKNQSLGNIPVSKVNSVVISNIIKNADLMPPGGIVPNNLPGNKPKNIAPTNSNAPAAGKQALRSGGHAAPSASAGTKTPSSVQSTSTAASTQKRRVIITAPLSPPATRNSRSKEVDSKGFKTDTISTLVKDGSRLETKPARRASPSSSAADKRAKESKNVKRKNRKETPKPSSTSTDSTSKSTPPVEVHITKKHKKKNKREKEKKARSIAPLVKVEEKVPATLIPEQRPPTLPSIDCDDDRLPTLALVVPPSPKKEEAQLEPDKLEADEDESVSIKSDCSNEERSFSPITCILPHDDDEDEEDVPVTQDLTECPVDENQSSAQVVVSEKLEEETSALEVDKLEMSPVQPISPVELLDTEAVTDPSADLLLIGEESSPKDDETSPEELKQTAHSLILCEDVEQVASQNSETETIPSMVERPLQPEHVSISQKETEVPDEEDPVCPGEEDNTIPLQDDEKTEQVGFQEDAPDTIESDSVDEAAAISTPVAQVLPTPEEDGGEEEEQEEGEILDEDDENDNDEQKEEEKQEPARVSPVLEDLEVESEQGQQSPPPPLLEVVRTVTPPVSVGDEQSESQKKAADPEFALDDDIPSPPMPVIKAVFNMEALPIEQNEERPDTVLSELSELVFNEIRDMETHNRPKPLDLESISSGSLPDSEPEDLDVDVDENARDTIAEVDETPILSPKTFSLETNVKCSSDSIEPGPVVSPDSNQSDSDLQITEGASPSPAETNCGVESEKSVLHLETVPASTQSLAPEVSSEPEMKDDEREGASLIRDADPEVQEDELESDLQLESGGAEKDMAQQLNDISSIHPSSPVDPVSATDTEKSIQGESVDVAEVGLPVENSELPLTLEPDDDENDAAPELYDSNSVEGAVQQTVEGLEEKVEGIISVEKIASQAEQDSSGIDTSVEESNEAEDEHVDPEVITKPQTTTTTTTSTQVQLISGVEENVEPHSKEGFPIEKILAEAKDKLEKGKLGLNTNGDCNHFRVSPVTVTAALCDADGMEKFILMEDDVEQLEEEKEQEEEDVDLYDDLIEQELIDQDDDDQMGSPEEPAPTPALPQTSSTVTPGKEWDMETDGSEWVASHRLTLVRHDDTPPSSPPPMSAPPSDPKVARNDEEDEETLYMDELENSRGTPLETIPEEDERLEQEEMAESKKNSPSSPCRSEVQSLPEENDEASTELPDSPAPPTPSETATTTATPATPMCVPVLELDKSIPPIDSERVNEEETNEVENVMDSEVTLTHESKMDGTSVQNEDMEMSKLTEVEEDEQLSGQKITEGEKVDHGTASEREEQGAEKIPDEETGNQVPKHTPELEEVQSVDHSHGEEKDSRSLEDVEMGEQVNEKTPESSELPSDRFPEEKNELEDVQDEEMVEQVHEKTPELEETRSEKILEENKEMKEMEDDDEKETEQLVEDVEQAGNDIPECPEREEQQKTEISADEEKEDDKLEHDVAGKIPESKEEEANQSDKIRQAEDGVTEKSSEGETTEFQGENNRIDDTSEETCPDVVTESPTQGESLSEFSEKEGAQTLDSPAVVATSPVLPSVDQDQDKDEEEVESERPEATLPPEISEFVLSVLEKKSARGKKKTDDLESISSESLASPQSEVEMENSIKMCIQTLESDPEEDQSEEKQADPLPKVISPEIPASILGTTSTKENLSPQLSESAVSPSTSAKMSPESTLPLSPNDETTDLLAEEEEASISMSILAKEEVTTLSPVRPRVDSPIQMIQAPQQNSPPMEPQEQSRCATPIPTPPTMEELAQNSGLPTLALVSSVVANFQAPAITGSSLATSMVSPDKATPQAVQTMQLASPTLTSTAPPVQPPMHSPRKHAAPSVKLNGVLKASPSKGTKRKLEGGYQSCPSRVQFVLPNNTSPIQNPVVAGQGSATLAPVPTSTTTPNQAYDPSLLYFVHPNGQQVTGGNYEILYAAASATTENDEGVSEGPANKIRLVFAEALGVEANTENRNDVQFVYTSAKLDQQVQQSLVPFQLHLREPYRITYSYDTDEARTEMLHYQAQPQNASLQIHHQQIQQQAHSYLIPSQGFATHPPTPQPQPGHSQQQLQIHQQQQQIHLHQQQQQQPIPLHQQQQQIHLHQQQQLQRAPHHIFHQQQQSHHQVLNLSVNPAPVYYYSDTTNVPADYQGQDRTPTSSSTTTSHQNIATSYQHQHSHSHAHPHEQYATETRVLVSNPSSIYPANTQMSSNMITHQQQHQQQYVYSNAPPPVSTSSSSAFVVQGQSQEHRNHLELPVFTAKENNVAYSHVSSPNASKQQLLAKALELQHLFPPGALRHCPTPVSYSIHPGSNGQVSAAGSAGGAKPLSGLDLLTEASEKMKELQDDVIRTERAAAAIAMVGELARLRRLGSASSHLGEQSMDQGRVNIVGQVPPNQAAGIRRGPRKYYLSRSANQQD